MSVRPAKTQIILGIRPVWSRSSLCAHWVGPKVSSCGQRRLWSDWADALADLSRRWAHTHFVSFVMSRHICNDFEIKTILKYICCLWCQLLQISRAGWNVRWFQIWIQLLIYINIICYFIPAFYKWMKLIGLFSLTIHANNYPGCKKYCISKAV